MKKEIDMFDFHGNDGRRYGVEVKRQDAPRLTPSMRVALSDLRLEHLTVLYPGSRRYALNHQVTVAPLSALADGDPRIVMPRTRGGRANSRRSGTNAR